MRGGGAKKLVENTWKADFAYDLEFKQRAQILLDLLSKEAKNHLKSDFSQNRFDLIVCAGLFEYIHDLPSFVSKICALQPKYILCSYNFVNVGGENKIWVTNRLKQKELFDLFLQNDFRFF